jgi:hypothetical protein
MSWFSPKSWWLNYAAPPIRFSAEERTARIIVYTIAGPIWLLSIWFSFTILSADEFFEFPWDRLAMLGEVVLGGVVAVCVGRIICGWLWPDLVRKADENAANRKNGIDGDRSGAST